MTSLKLIVHRLLLTGKWLAVLLIAIFLLLSINNYLLPIVHADECDIDCLQKQIDALNQVREQSVNATKPLEGQLDSLKRQLAQLQNSLRILSNKIDQREKDLEIRKQRLAELMVVFNERVSKDYKNGYALDTIGILFGSTGKFSDRLYRLATINENHKIINSISEEVVGLVAEKEKLEKDKASLASLQAQVDKNASFIGGEVAKAKKYQSDLSNQIAELSAKQQSILASRLASLGIPLYASSGGACSSDLTNGKNPGFSEGVGLFTYGVPNRVGLNQYGAFGRARSGQNYTQILQAYYNFDLIEKRDATINVEGYHGYSLDDYTKRIYEVPDDWGSQGGMEALKAQAIAARSYAMAYTNSGAGSICTTQQCQVFKSDPKGGNWEQAVNATSGMVMISGGSPVKAWFSSTHGGYIHSSSDIGWSGTSWTKNAQDAASSINSWDDLKNNAYDKDSPWFYCDWGSRSDFGGTAWLKPDEIADIANVVLLASADSGIREHLYQVDKPNLAGTDTWDASRVKQELRSRGISPFDSVSSISVSADFGSGKTTSVNINGQGFSGDLFKTYFNLRAPANIQIVGPLYNIEKK